MTLLESQRSSQVYATKYNKTGHSANVDLIANGPLDLTVKQDNYGLNDKPIIHNNGEWYTDYRLTDLQFELSTNETDPSIKITIPYSNRLTAIEAKYAIICFYDPETHEWNEIDSINNTEQMSFEFETDVNGIFGICINKYWYSTFTQSLANEYPQWTRIRKSKESIGQQFLNFFGIHLEEVEDWLNWIDEQKHLVSAETKMLDWIYTYSLPKINQNDDIRIFYQKDNKTYLLPILESIHEFFYNDANEGGIIDYRERKFYCQDSYDQIRGIVKNKDGVSEFKATPKPYHIWNTLDEFGLLLNLKRNYLETNTAFKNRLLDVFRYPANTSKDGLSSGIARELNLITHNENWLDDSNPFLIYNKSGWLVDLNSIKVDYQPLESDQFEILNGNHILIYPLNQGRNHTVSLIAGIEKYEFHDTSNPELHYLMFKDNGQATERMIDWVAYINTVAPIMWNKFKWGEGYWDTVSKELSGVGYIPNMWDTDTENWKNYSFTHNRWEDSAIWKRI
ncbi:hypothetical protein [Virgibacillus salexigens]|uniref:Uncharacterized protein n=1 Tax=Virgibacillus massiliensis TaxID=1462526 RepID=A0A024QGV7_9BACI|nr:hypothetical protein [Virgibacillus massiliensis]CDQ41793.1 hypothetical protein BN990_04170 [Virgibacillus massiliensis]